MTNEVNEDLIIEIAEYHLSGASTVRRTAKVYGLSSSTIHVYLAKKLWLIDKSLAQKIKVLSEENFKARNRRGGLARAKLFKSARRGVSV